LASLTLLGPPWVDSFAEEAAVLRVLPETDPIDFIVAEMAALAI